MSRIPVSAEIRDKQRKAVELRLAGANYYQIAQALGYSGHTGARHAVQRGLTLAITEPAAEVLQQELARLDRLMSGLWTQAVQGNMLAVDRILKIMDRRAKYLGLDQIKVDVTTYDGDLADLDAALQALTTASSSPAGLAFHSTTGAADSTG